MNPVDISDLAARVIAGEVRAAARAMRVIDDRREGYISLLRALYAHTGKAYVIGITGNPGAGKSTLTDKLIEAYRAKGSKVGVIAVDPTSPFSGGAILGDRIRMQRHFLDEGVFIRSLATRGHLGGLSRSATDVMSVLDAFGCDVILVETVGVGQDELEVTKLAHTTLVIVSPGMGDDIQAIKAGILEIADVFVVNKADREGADATVRDLEQMLAMSSDALKAIGSSHSHSHVMTHAEAPDAQNEHANEWRPPVLRAVAVKGEGISKIVESCEAHRAFLSTTEEGARRTKDRARDAFMAVFREMLFERALKKIDSELEKAIERNMRHEGDPYGDADHLLTLLWGGVNA